MSALIGRRRSPRGIKRVSRPSALSASELRCHGWGAREEISMAGNPTRDRGQNSCMDATCILTRIPGKVYSLEGSPTEAMAPLNLAADKLGVRILTIDGRKMQTAEAVYTEMAAVCEFPWYFGRNWDALDECLCDMEWMPAAGYCLLVTDAELMLLNDQHSQRDVLLSVLSRATEEWAVPINLGEAWDRPARPFSVILFYEEAPSDVAGFVASLESIE